MSADDERDRAIQDAPNSDPTGGGPPPAGAITRVTSEGRGVTQGSDGLNASDDRAHAAGPHKVSTGPNARPRNETISSTGPGLPNDASTPVEIDPAEEAAIAQKIRDL